MTKFKVLMVGRKKKESPETKKYRGITVINDKIKLLFFSFLLLIYILVEFKTLTMNRY